MAEESAASTTETAAATGQETQTETQQSESSLTPPKPIVGGEEAISPDGEKASEGEKKTEEAKPEARAPAEYVDFTLPEGMTMDDAQTSEFKSFAKEQDLTQEQAQKVLEYGGARLKALIEAPYKTWSELQTKWQAEVKADPEIGGTKYEQSIRNAALVFAPGESNPFVKTADEAKVLREALNTTGAGNNPAMVRLFVRLGSLLAEPGTLTGNPPKQDRGQALLDSMYDNMPGPGTQA